MISISYLLYEKTGDLCLWTRYQFARAAITKYHIGWHKQEKFIFHSSEGWQSKIQVSARWFLRRPLSLAYRQLPLHCDLSFVSKFPPLLSTLV